MIANNIFRAIGNFFTDVLFAPYNFLRLKVENWWVQNTFAWIAIFITFMFFFYWLGQLRKFKKNGTE